MTMDEARNLVKSPIWAKVRDAYLATGSFTVYPKGDFRRIEYLDAKTRGQIELWLEALKHIAERRTIVDGQQVRELKAAYPGVYPDVLRYALYFAGKADPLPTLLKLKFPEAYELCCS